MLVASLIGFPALLPLPSVAQSNEGSRSNEMDASPSQGRSEDAPKLKAPIGAVTFGYIYIASEEVPGTWQPHLQGFFGIPQININHWFGFNGDFTGPITRRLERTRMCRLVLAASSLPSRAVPRFPRSGSQMLA
jgi:hypothetical protein